MLGQISAEIAEMGDREEGLELRIARARKTMIAKANAVLHPSVGGAFSSPTVTHKPTEDPISTPERETEFSSHKISSPDSKAHSGTPTSTSDQLTPKRKQRKVGTTKLYSIIIFDEFLKELAAISHEQSILSPALYRINDDDDDDVT